jgi:hypothetical protein
MANIQLQNINNNQMTNNEKAIAELFALLCAVVRSEKTPPAIKQATISTFGDLIGKDDSVFRSEELIDLTIAMNAELTSIVRQLNGEQIINNVLTNNLNLN